MAGLLWQGHGPGGPLERPCPRFTKWLLPFAWLNLAGLISHIAFSAGAPTRPRQAGRRIRDSGREGGFSGDP